MAVSAVVFNGDGTYELRTDFEVPDPPTGGAVLAVEAVGLCHSDVSQLNGHRHVPGETAPIVPGHEIVGRVHALHEEADLGVEIGDRVAVDVVVFGPPTDENPLGLDVYGYTRGLDDAGGLWGGYGEYMMVSPGSHLMQLTEEASAAELTIFEPLASCINWLDLCRFRAGQSVVIQGPGHMGLTCAAMAKHRDAGLIVVTGTGADAHRLDVARQIGADLAIAIDADDPVEAVREATNGQMADVAIDLANTPATPGLCVDLVRQGGEILWAGLKDGAAVSVISDDVVTRGLTIRGGSGATPQSMETAVAVLNSGEFPTEPLLGEVVTIDQLDLAMDYLNRTAPTDAVRAVLTHRS